MQIITQRITRDHIKALASGTFGDFVKAVVDVERRLVAIDAELHSDLEALLLDGGSQQANLWGINLYPEVEGDDFIEFDSMINLRPSQSNMTRGVGSQDIQKKIIDVVNAWVR